MKSIRIIIIGVSLITAISSCKNGNDDDGGLSSQELAFEKLAGNWTLKSSSAILLDGQDVSVNYPDFSLSFTNSTYTTTNAGGLFNATGTWSWQDEEAGAISTDDGKTIAIVNLTETLFRFTFTFDGSGGVANGVAGDYDITIEK